MYQHGWKRARVEPGHRAGAERDIAYAMWDLRTLETGTLENLGSYYAQCSAGIFPCI